jgi:hypothetical protein
VPLLIIHRLILYFPVSALVTLFGNILQNPQDPRARSDVRLMNMVVNFLSMLCQEEGNGGVKRMLDVCFEFEKIAKGVLDKAERDSTSRKKRKSHETQTKQTRPLSSSGPAPTPMMSNGHSPAMPAIFSPNMGTGMGNQLNLQNGFGSVGHGSPHSAIWQPDFSNGNGAEYMTPTENVMSQFSDTHPAYTNGYSNGSDMASPLDQNNYQQQPQPFIPNDVWQMPMGIQWDWGAMTGVGEVPGFENGDFDPNFHQTNTQHLQNQQM